MAVLYGFLVVFGISLVLGIVLAIADKFLKVEEDERVSVVCSMLAGANCGGCGYPGCHGLADAIVNKGVNELNLCKPTKAEQKEKIREYLNLKK